MNRMDWLFLGILLVCGVVFFWAVFGALVWGAVTGRQP